jgi:hypothetical protein
MTKLALVFLAVISAVAIADNHVMGDHKSLTFDCGKDARTAIMGNHNAITLTGACDEVSVTGNNNTVTGDKAKTLNVTGNDNALTLGPIETVNVNGNNNALIWKKGSPTDAGPKVSNVGNGNKITSK